MKKEKLAIYAIYTAIFLVVGYLAYTGWYVRYFNFLLGI